MATKSNLFLGSVAPRTGSWHADATEPQLLLITDPVSREMWKICQAFRLRYESFVPDSTPLPPQYPQRNLAGFSAGLGILIIGGKKRKSPQFQNVRPPANGGLFFCWRQTGAAKLRQPADLALRPDLPLAGCLPVSCLLVTRTNAAFMRTRDAFIRTNPSFMRTNVSMTGTTQLTRPQSSSPVPRMNASFMRTRDAFTRIKQLTCYQPLSMPSVAKRQRIKHMQNSPRGRGGQTRRDNALMRTALDRLVVRELTVDDAGS